MDQTPVYYSYHSGRTLSMRGVRSVNVLSSMTSTLRATLNAAVSMSGHKFKPFTVFKGAPDGTIASRELPTFSQDGLWATQKNAWCDERIMHLWINGSLVPEIQNVQILFPGVTPLLLLDTYKVHLMGEIVETIQSHGVEVMHIPAGCTYLCQLVDVGINKPLK